MSDLICPKCKRENCPRINPDILAREIEDAEICCLNYRLDSMTVEYDLTKTALDNALRATVELGKQLAEERERRMKAEAEAERLKTEIVLLLETILTADGYLEQEGNHDGWYDSQALSHVRDVGDRLVELGVWERHPDGSGMRQWYRKKVM